MLVGSPSLDLDGFERADATRTPQIILGVGSSWSDRAYHVPAPMITIRNRAPWWAWPLLVVFLPLAALAFVLWLAAAGVLQVIVWIVWCARGRYALVVYSNSPIWQEYFEHHVLPAVGDRGVVLNWSERKHWPYSLATAVFHVFAGTRNFNPLAVVIEPLAWPRYFRFYRPFQAFKHGRPEEVEQMLRRLLDVLDRLAPPAKIG